MSTPVLKPTLKRGENMVIKSTNLTLIDPKYLSIDTEELELESVREWANVIPYTRPLWLEILIRKRQVIPLTTEELNKLANPDDDEIHSSLHLFQQTKNK